MDRLLLEQAQVDAAGSTPSLVPGLSGGPTVDAKVVVKEPRQVAGILQNHHQVSGNSSKWRRDLFIILPSLSEFKQKT